MIKVEDLYFSRGRKPVLNIQSLSVKHGERIALLGPSGSGKTTLLRLIAGLETESKGTIRLDGVAVSGRNYVPPSERGINMLMQDYGLWSHLTALQHLAFVRRSGKSIRPTESDRELLGAVGLGHKYDAYPAQLSGGEQQRLALARTMARDADILFLDEPFSNVDAVLGRELMSMLDCLQNERNMTRIMVTHDIEEAIRTSDRLFVMDNGRVVHQGTWQELCESPRGCWSRRLVEMYGV